MKSKNTICDEIVVTGNKANKIFYDEGIYLLLVLDTIKKSEER